MERHRERLSGDLKKTWVGAAVKGGWRNQARQPLPPGNFGLAEERFGDSVWHVPQPAYFPGYLHRIRRPRGVYISLGLCNVTQS